MAVVTDQAVIDLYHEIEQTFGGPQKAAPHYVCEAVARELGVTVDRVRSVMLDRAFGLSGG